MISPNYRRKLLLLKYLSFSVHFSLKGNSYFIFFKMFLPLMFPKQLSHLSRIFSMNHIPAPCSKHIIKYLSSGTLKKYFFFPRQCCGKIWPVIDQKRKQHLLVVHLPTQGTIEYQVISAPILKTEPNAPKVFSFPDLFSYVSLTTFLCIFSFMISRKSGLHGL